MIAEVDVPRHQTYAALPEPEGVSLVREFLVRQLAEWGLSKLVMDVELVGSELVTNAILHAHSPEITVVLSATDTVLQITVWSHTNGAVTMKSPSATDESGRGLRIVDALAASWGILNCGTHVCVFVNLKI